MERRLSEGCANATVNRELAAIKRIFNLAARCTPPKVAQKPYVAMRQRNGRYLPVTSPHGYKMVAIGPGEQKRLQS
ncbi:MAG: hypothetical protein A2V65_10920 [Deltaproteobacteria bacterium RBG_13_49_15]|nr:MAG: hypothetical protein A2V65_10920 [Deltaproteobacteria bacterium RBG_13_49_15]